MGLRAWAAAGLAALALAVAGCGSGHPPSALNPARLVPGNAIAYLELTVRPQGAQRDGAESALTKLLGHSPDADLQHAVDHVFRGSGLSYEQDVKPWLGQRIGFMADAFSLDGIALIAPTSDPAAAVAAFARAERHHGRLLGAQSYSGVKYQLASERGGQVALGAVGHYAVIGGTGAFKQIVDTYRGRVAPLDPSGSGALARAYVNEPRAVAAVMALPTITPAVRQELRTVFARAHLPTSVNLSLSASAHALAADVRSSGAPGSGAGTGGPDVSGLPGDSWLAVSTGNSLARQVATGFNAGVLQGFSRAARASGINPNLVLQQFRRRTGIDLTNDLLPALGPFQFAVEGSSLTTIQAALALYPSNPFAGARLFEDIHRLVARDHSLRVINGSRSFRFGPSSIPFPIVGVADLGRKIVARFALSNTHRQTGKLSANPTFTRAHARLPAGSTVPLFLDFGPLASLLSQTPQFKQAGSDYQALTVLKRLDYLVIGTSAGTHDTRIVLGLR
jgi:hypothetical protein